jgi:hypothetical protein
MDAVELRGAASGALAGLVAVALVTCADGPNPGKGDGVVDSEVPVVADSEPSSCASGLYGQDLVYVDADGTAISNSQEFIDADGLIWTIDIFAPQAVEEGLPSRIALFSEASCTGDRYIEVPAPPHPRRPFRIPEEPGYFAIGDHGVPVVVASDTSILSFRNREGTCFDGQPITLGLSPLALTTDLVAYPAAAAPAFAYVAPLHLEIR